MNKTREQLAEIFIKALEEEKIDWIADFQSLGRAENITTNKSYRGNNLFLLTLMCNKYNYGRNEWCTFNQAKEAGFKIKKGAKGVPVEFFSLYDKGNKRKVSIKEYEKLIKTMTAIEIKERFKAINMISYVFNVYDMENIPEKNLIPKSEVVKIDKVVEFLVKNMEVEVKGGNNGCHYSIKEDSITMVAMNKFDSSSSYNQTLLHEICHATGHEKRLDRNLLKGGKKERAKEELRAEIASCFLANDIPDILNDNLIENSKAYVQSWAEVLKSDKEELFKAIKDADKIYNYIYDNSLMASKETIKDKENVLSDKRKKQKDVDIDI